MRDALSPALRPGLFETLRADISRYRPRTRRSALAIALTTTEFQIVCLYRCAHAANARNLRILARVLKYLQNLIYASDLHYAAQIGPGLRLKHGMNIVVGEGTRIGRDATLFNGVTFGTKGVLDVQYPSAGDRVFVGTGAKILGSVRIGDDVVVGANSVVLDDVADAAVVVGAPARPVRQDLTARTLP